MVKETADFPIENGGSFHGYVSQYQRVNPRKPPLNQHFPMVFLWFSLWFSTAHHKGYYDTMIIYDTLYIIHQISWFYIFKLQITLTYIYIYYIWLVVSNPLKHMKVSWDDEIPNIWKKNKNVPNHQPASHDTAPPRHCSLRKQRASTMAGSASRESSSSSTMPARPRRAACGFF